MYLDYRWEISVISLWRNLWSFIADSAFQLFRVNENLQQRRSEEDSHNQQSQDNPENDKDDDEEKRKCELFCK